MPSCSRCGTEYPMGVTRCSHCSPELVDKSSPEGESETREEKKGLSQTPWVFLKSTLNDIEADVISGLLEANGIPTMRKYPNISGLAKIYLGSSFGVEIYVPNEHLEEARLLIIPDFF